MSQGLGTEGLRLTLEEAHRIVPEEEICLRVNLDNPASLHVMLNNGGRIVSQDEEHYFVRIPNPGKGGFPHMVSGTGEMDQSQRISYVTSEDRAFWFSLDHHLSEEAFASKVRDRMGLVLSVGNEPVGILRWSLFWDSIPFCNLLYIKDAWQRKGYGRKLMEYWEEKMHCTGHDLVMTSTQADEEAQHFYRALGYGDCGGFILPFPGYEQPMELILAKSSARDK